MKRAELPERIETERLVLRNRTLADAEDIFGFASRPEVSYPAGFPPVKTLEDEIYYLEPVSYTHLLQPHVTNSKLPKFWLKMTRKKIVLSLPETTTI